MDELKCTKVIRVDDGRDPQGKPLFYHKKCGNPASECEIGGLLTSAKAILCSKHRQMAENEAFISSNGFRKGKITRKAKKEGYQQTALPGTGVIV